MNQTRKDVLNGWKEIAAYLGRDPRTVERWEKQRSLPVRRLPGSGRATVYALVPELDNWLASSPLREAEPFATESLLTSAPDLSPGNGSTAAVSEEGRAVGRVAADHQSVTGPAGYGRAWGSLRWTVAAALLLLLVCGAGLATAAWRRKHASAAAVHPDLHEGGRGRKMVPSSPVFGVEELYLRGCYQSEMRTPESLRRAEEAFTSAIRKDPRYAPAYAGLGSAYLLEREYSTLPDAQAYTQAKEAAGKALALDPDLPQAHAVMGFVDFFWSWDAVAAERQFQRALQVDPDLPLAHHWYGSVLTHEGKFREGLAQLEVAQRLDPTSGAILTMRAFALGLNGKQTEGYELLEQAVSGEKAGQNRNPATMHNVMGLLCLMPPRNVPRYLAETTLAAELRQDTQTVEAMHLAGEVFRQRGEQAMWKALLLDEQRRHSKGGPTYAMARYKAQLGANDQALSDLADLFSRHDSALIGVSVDPLFSGLRQEPRFLQLRAAMGLPGVDET